MKQITYKALGEPYRPGLRGERKLPTPILDLGNTSVGKCSAGFKQVNHIFRTVHLFYYSTRKKY